MADDHAQRAALRDVTPCAQEIAELMSGPVKERPAIVVIGDDAVAGIDPPPANDP